MRSVDIRAEMNFRRSPEPEVFQLCSVEPIPSHLEQGHVLRFPLGQPPGVQTGFVGLKCAAARKFNYNRFRSVEISESQSGEVA